MTAAAALEDLVAQRERFLAFVRNQTCRTCATHGCLDCSCRA